VTHRLYHDDPWLLAFDAAVTAHASWQGRPSLVLDRTAFYPESGGQLGDRGTLGGQTVVDVQVDEAGTVHHVIDLTQGALPEVGSRLEGQVDRARRRVHMALHTGQHMLSSAFVDVCEAATVSSRLGERDCTIDLDRPGLAEADVARAEALCNAVIDDDVPIRAFFPAPGELEALPLRRRPKVHKDVRVIQIGNFDVSPCGGTHCTRTGQVGLVRILGFERYKGGTRITFDAGPRARQALFDEDAALRELARRLSCGVGDVFAQFDRLSQDLAEARTALGQARGRLLEAQASELAAAARAAGKDRVVAVIDGGDQAALRQLARRITDGGLIAILTAPGETGVHLLAARPAGSTFDCGAFVKSTCAAAGGKGGGKPESAEGKLPLGAVVVA
jgi:alanyl-tRNA synthetase